MDVVISYNPIAGRGKAGQLAREIAGRLRADSIGAELLDRGPGALRRDAAGVIGAADALVIVGGDGSVNALAGDAQRSGTPIYQVPTGTENLFARQFGMDRSYETLLRALRGGKTVGVDVGDCNGRPFLLMCSVGFDANVVHRLARVRNGPIRHSFYARHIAAELWNPVHTPLTIRVDGSTVVENRSGFVVVANSRQYAMRLDPAVRADMCDSQFDVVFTPFQSRARLIAWTLGMRLRMHLGARDLIYERGSEVNIEGGPAVYQLDGDAPSVATGEKPALTPLHITLRPRAVKVLLPEGSSFTAPAADCACCDAG